MVLGTVDNGCCGCAWWSFVSTHAFIVCLLFGYLIKSQYIRNKNVLKVNLEFFFNKKTKDVGSKANYFLHEQEK